mmetsp:Transcript_22389/g.47062  ORF Transcript_22389/g.47062 Transcript_22389/m.47062 type:complete len:92 (+) Transcript_22389:386-661(+)
MTRSRKGRRSVVESIDSFGVSLLSFCLVWCPLFVVSREREHSRTRSTGLVDTHQCVGRAGCQHEFLLVEFETAHGPDPMARQGFLVEAGHL